MTRIHIARVLLLAVWLLSSAASTSAQPPAQLRFTGELDHNWRGPVEGQCSLLVQAFDAALNGTSFGAAYESAPQRVAAGALHINVPASALPARTAPTWLRLGVRCTENTEIVWMAPRLEHHGPLVIGLPAQSAFLCAMPGGTAANTGPPMVEGSDYTLHGGFAASRG